MAFAFDATISPEADMTNVVALNAPQRRQSDASRLAAHARLFLSCRREDGDVFWLKENAEFLTVLECTAQSSDVVLPLYEPLYSEIDTRLGDFPQYYRFHLSMCLDLEDLGMAGGKGEILCEWVKSQGLVLAELSDLQRAESRRLLARRAIQLTDDGLDDRLREFVERCCTFAIPNRKAAYELTHIVFYLSDYGRREPMLGAAAKRSLTYAGLLAYLDQNHDLLAEVCLAMRYAGETPSPIWEAAVMTALATARAGHTTVSLPDDYHTYLMGNWLAGVMQRPVMQLNLLDGPARIDLAAPSARPLLCLGRYLRDLRVGDWAQAREHVLQSMNEAARHILEKAEDSVKDFGAFYERFARASNPYR